ncbi:hypothetical protein MESS4_120183 [Mesorhizobium sp. STM 4661]|nr:hypothetical protein MESS4_120183 [Mesorhizobium sp. STM 4661]
MIFVTNGRTFRRRDNPSRWLLAKPGVLEGSKGTNQYGPDPLA